MQSALQVEPENDQMMRQSRLIRNKRNEAMNAKGEASGGLVKKQLSESAQKEFEALREGAETWFINAWKYLELCYETRGKGARKARTINSMTCIE